MTARPLAKQSEAARGIVGQVAQALRAGRQDKRMFYTYVLLSIKDNNHYIGWTDNLKLRLEKHTSGKVYATKNSGPLKLIYFEASLNKQRAIKREKYFKTGFGRRFITNNI